MPLSQALTAPGLDSLHWLVYGFGTRLSPFNQNQMASLTQIHSTQVLSVIALGSAGEGDALITNAPAVPISIRTADCLPILLADTEHFAVGAVHAGWRGTAGEIVCRTLDTMRSEFGTGNWILLL
jgi:polyphenol oxidase